MVIKHVRGQRYTRDCQVSFHYYQHFYRGEILLSITEKNDVSIASIHRLTKIHTFITLLIQDEVLSSVRRGVIIGFMGFGLGHELLQQPLSLPTYVHCK